MILFRVFIKNKEVINRVYWGDGPDDAGIQGYKADIAKAFPGQTFPYPVSICGKDMGSANVLTIHQCTVGHDSALKSKLEYDLMIDQDFIRYIYDLDTNTKSYELFYKNNNAYTMQPLGEGLTVYRISDMFDANFNNLGKQSCYVQGSNQDVFAWAESLKPGIDMPISVDKKLHPDDSYRFEFNSDRELVSVTLFAHLDRTMVWNAAVTDTYVEYTADYADELTNLSDTEIVVPRYDEFGNRIASDPTI